MLQNLPQVPLRYAFLLLLNFFFTHKLAAQTEVLLPALKDNTLHQSTTGAFSNGSGAYFFVGRNNHGEVRRALLAFDLAGNVPAGAVLQSVKLTLNMSKALPGAHNIALHRALADWGEGASDAGGEEGGGADAAIGDATWIHTFFNTKFWNNAGGDFAPSASATLAVSGAGAYTWESTPAMVGEAQAWLEQPASNFGWLLLGNETLNASTKRFDARQNSAAANRPVLRVVYAMPNRVTNIGAELPITFALAQNYPNPFNPVTHIGYRLPQPARVQLAIYNILGVKVRTLVSATQAAGDYHASWNGVDEAGEPVAGGVYFYRFATADFVATRKLVLLR
ncbi:MAG: DNRLRE domain-containing protein [candidate division KSB1 bacterium]